jgi:hypothetical protein
MLDVTDASQLAAAISRLLAAPSELASLTAAAQARRFKSWSDYAAELTGWMQTLRRRGA